MLEKGIWLRNKGQNFGACFSDFGQEVPQEEVLVLACGIRSKRQHQ